MTEIPECFRCHVPMRHGACPQCGYEDFDSLADYVDKCESERREAMRKAREFFDGFRQPDMTLDAAVMLFIDTFPSKAAALLTELLR
jgi:hypothetical protein